ncbi:MAG TPA: sulfatase [Vicinamibacteria bacterium]|nr:sulfatase [Vicinamibacteria bacterium]
MVRRLLFASLLLATAACGARPGNGKGPLIQRPTTTGAPARSGALSTGGETRPALLESAAYRVRLPERALLTFGMGVAWAGEGEAPGWYRLSVRAGGRTLDERTLNPRAARGWREVSLWLPQVKGETQLEFDLRLTDRDGKPETPPPGLLLGIADPIVHDVDDYGSSKGVVLVSIDTLRRDHVGTYGYGKPTTPAIDALAARSVVADDAVSVSSWTLPAHLSMLTSVDPGAHGGVDMQHGSNKRFPALATLFKRAGYATQAITSHLYVSGVYGLDEGFDFLDFHQDRRASDVADRAIGLLDRLGDKPFFLFLHFYDPHWHYAPPPETLGLFESSYTGKVTGLWGEFSKLDRSALKPADLAHILALYDGEIRYTDDHLKRVLTHMTERGLDRGTLVLVTSDHGEEFLEHGSWEHQKTLYEEVVRIPLLLAGPSVTPRREARQASLLDVAPTVLAWAGLEVPGHMQGRSLLAPLPEREAYGETDHTNDGTRKLFLRSGQGRGKTILSLRRQDAVPAREEWYDLAADPGETRSRPPRADAAEVIRRRAIERWKQARGRGAGAPQVTLSEEQRERLRALGYVVP